MAAKKVIFFTAGITATTGENAAIAQLNALAAPAYEVVVMNTKVPQSTPIRAADYAAGTIPTAYSATPVIDPANPPTGLPATKAIVTEGDVLTLKNSAGTAVPGVTTVHVAASVVTANLAATVATVANGVDIVTPVTGVYATKIKATVVNGVITGFVLS